MTMLNVYELFDDVGGKVSRPLSVWHSMLKEWYKALGIPIMYWQVSEQRTASVVDDVYDEVMVGSEIKYVSPKEVHCRVVSYDFSEMLRRYGVEDVEGVELIVCRKELEEVFIEKPQIGDIVELRWVKYRVTEVLPNTYINTPEVVLEWKLRVEQVREKRV